MKSGIFGNQRVGNKERTIMATLSSRYCIARVCSLCATPEGVLCTWMEVVLFERDEEREKLKFQSTNKMKAKEKQWLG